MQISFVGFQPIQSSEHMAAFGIFGLCQLLAFYNYTRSKLTNEQFDVLFRFASYLLGSAFLGVSIILTITGSKEEAHDFYIFLGSLKNLQKIK